MKRGVNLGLAVCATLAAAAAWRVFWGMLAAPWALAIVVAGRATDTDAGTLWLAWRLRREEGDAAILEAATLGQVLALDALGWGLTACMAGWAWRLVRRNQAL